MRLARLPIAEKVRILVEMQKMAATLLKAQGKKAIVWRLSVQDKKGLGEVRKITGGAEGK